MGLLDMDRDVNHPSLKQQKITGFVVDNNDPEKRQRVKVRVPQFHRGIPDEDLPWILPQSNGGAASNGGGGQGAVNVPPLNTKLFVHMEAEDPHNIYYGGSPTTDDVNKDNEILQEDYPNTYGHVDAAGNKVATNAAKKTMTMTHVSGTTVHIGSGGEVIIYSSSDMSFMAEGKAVFAGKGGTFFGIDSSNTSVKGSKIDLNGDGDGITPAKVGKRTKPVLTERAGKVEV